MAKNPQRPMRLTFSTGRVIQRTRTAMTKAFRQFASEMEKSLKVAVNKAYPPPSTPGYPPHKRTGFLQANIKVKPNGDKGLALTVPAYGIWLEYGVPKRSVAKTQAILREHGKKPLKFSKTTKVHRLTPGLSKGWKIAPRPFIEPLVQKNRRAWEARLNDLIRRYAKE
jgi:hypothetical protein